MALKMVTKGSNKKSSCENSHKTAPINNKATKVKIKLRPPKKLIQRVSFFSITITPYLDCNGVQKGCKRIRHFKLNLS